MRKPQDARVLKAVAAEIRARRNQLDITQDELAHRASVNRSFVAKVEVAQSQPTIAVFLRIAEALGVDAATFISAIVNRSKREA